MVGVDAGDRGRRDQQRAAGRQARQRLSTAANGSDTYISVAARSRSRTDPPQQPAFREARPINVASIVARIDVDDPTWSTPLPNKLE